MNPFIFCDFRLFLPLTGADFHAEQIKKSCRICGCNIGKKYKYFVKHEKIAQKIDGTFSVDTRNDKEEDQSLTTKMAAILKFSRVFFFGFFCKH